MPRDIHLPKLFELFRQRGYEGVSLSEISAATGLGRASLYHHFPGGKAEMVSATLDYSGRWVEENVLPVLCSEGAAQERLQQMCDRLNELYASGEKPCLLAALTTGATPDAFHESVKARMAVLANAIAAVLTESGLDPALAQQRGEDALVIVQGALIVSKGLGDAGVFRRAIARLPQSLCQDL